MKVGIIQQHNNAQILDNDGSYELSDEYIATIIDPLPKRHIKDGWYGDRSKSTRRHMGTDIRAREGQDIPSCTAGEIVRIAYNDIALALSGSSSIVHAAAISRQSSFPVTVTLVRSIRLLIAFTSCAAVRAHIWARVCVSAASSA